MDDNKALTEIDHVLQRPAIYIGGVTTEKKHDWVWDESTNKMVHKEIITNSGLVKAIFEVIDNAVDNCSVATNPTTTIAVNMDGTTVTVKNNGDSVKIEKKDIGNGVVDWIPSTVFGVFRTGRNFNGNRKGVIGMNGLGVKLTNVVSNKFSVTCHREGQKFTQMWTDHMKNKGKAKVTKISKLPSFTTLVSFTPDLSYFKTGVGGIRIESLDAIKEVIHTKLLHASVTNPKPIKLYFNGKAIKCRDMKAYMKLFTSERTFYEKVSPDFEYGVTLSPTGEFEQQSFVNCHQTSNPTSKEVKHVTTKVVAAITTALKKKGVTTKLSASQISRHLFIFINTRMADPQFDAQTKSSLTSVVDPKVLAIDVKKVVGLIKKSGLMDKLEAQLNNKEMSSMQNALNGSKATRIRVPKLDDALDAGTKKSGDTMLFLVEGDSAKTMVVAGMSVIGRSSYGVFPLKGKLLNVMGASASKLKGNAEICNIMKIIGLNFGKSYNTPAERKTLRYGKVCVLCDADSVTGDTPLLLKRDGQICVMNIEDLFNGEHPVTLMNGKEYTECGYMAWTERGWTPIRKVMRHNTNKRIMRVLSHTGVVDVTEDHSLLTEDAAKVSPKSVEVGDKLLHSFPLFSKRVKIPDELESLTLSALRDLGAKMCVRNVNFKFKDELLPRLNGYRDRPVEVLSGTGTTTVGEAWVMGFFMADGSCRIGKRLHGNGREYTYYNWSITNTDRDLLVRCKEIMRSIYGDVFNLCEIARQSERHSRLYKLILNGGRKTASVIEKYRTMFYYKDWKYIHPDILNAPLGVRKAFYEGYYEGDGAHNKACSPRFDVLGKITSQCLYVLAKSIGKTVSVNWGVAKRAKRSTHFIPTTDDFNGIPIRLRR